MLTSIIKRADFSPIGVDMGATSLKLVQVIGKKDKTEIISALTEFENGESEEERKDILCETLKQTLTKGKFKGKEAVICLSQKDVDFRQVIMNDDVDESVERVLDKEASSLPYPLNEAIIDYIDMGETMLGGEKRNKILMISVQKNIVQDAINILQNAKLRCTVVDIFPSVLFRAVENNENENKKIPIAVIDVGHKKSLAVVFNGRNMVLNRTIPVGIDAFVKSVAKELEISGENARNYLFDYGIGTNSTSLSFLKDINSGEESDIPSLISDVIKEDLERFTSGIEQIFRFCSSELRGIRPGKVILCGGGAMLKNLTDYLQERFQVQFNVWNPSAIINSNGIDENGKNNDYEISPRYTVALGLALRGAKK